MSFEDNITAGMMSKNNEKTFIDKILAREDVNSIRELIKKPELERTDVLEILYMLSSVESKLQNYGEWDRYIMLKFFVWLREFIMAVELNFDYEDSLKLKFEKTGMELSDRSKSIMKKNKQMLEHNAKFLIDLYLNIGRTTLSLGAHGFTEILKNKYEISYPQMAGMTQQQNQTGGTVHR